MLVDRKRKKLLLLLSCALILVWVVATLLNKDDFLGEVFTNIYYVIALVGGVLGILVARQWGGFGSYLGKSLSFLAGGLLLTVMGQLVNSYYVLISKLEELPYPSVAEIGFFGAVLFYIFGAYYLSKTVRLLPSIRKMSVGKKILLSLVPISMMAITFLVYFRNYSSEGSTTAQVILDFAYPIGQSIFATIALAVLFLSKDLYGGKLRGAVILLLLSFILQYAADTNFVYQDLAGNWVNGGYGDFLYLLAYSATALGVLSFNMPKTDATTETPAELPGEQA